MNFYLFPPSDYAKVHDVDLERLAEVIDYLKEYENIRIPNEFYEKKDIHEKVFFEFMTECASEASRFFLSVMREQISFEKLYQEIYDSSEEFALVVFHASDCKRVDDTILIQNIEKQAGDDAYIPSDITKAYRYYLRERCSTYANYAQRAPSCFPDIVLHNNAFTKINKLGKFENVFEELTRHLIALNDVATFLYPKYHAEGTLLRLKSNCHIYCSGKGSAESNDYNVDMTYKGKTYTLTCQPHTKLFDSHTKQRIYFCWGRNEIEHHAIIVVRIGDHFY